MKLVTYHTIILQFLWSYKIVSCGRANTNLKLSLISLWWFPEVPLLFSRRQPPTWSVPLLDSPPSPSPSPSQVWSACPTWLAHLRIHTSALHHGAQVSLYLSKGKKNMVGVDLFFYSKPWNNSNYNLYRQKLFQGNLYWTAKLCFLFGLKETERIVISFFTYILCSSCDRRLGVSSLFRGRD